MLKDKLNFNYFPDSWYPVLLSQELKKLAHIEVKVFNTEIILFRAEDHSIGALKPICSHMGTRFRAGKVCKNFLQCPLHLREFDKQGQCQKILGTEEIPTNAHLFHLKTHEYAGIIFVFLGEKPFKFPEFNKVKSEVSYSKPAHYFLNTPYQALIFNGFDTHHLGCIHSREILNEPIFNIAKNVMTAEYSMGVLVNSFYDKFVKLMSSHKNDIFLECFGGNFLIITNKSTKDNILITSVPITYTKSRIFLTALSEKENGFLNSNLQKLRLAITTYLGVRFLKPDIKIIEEMRPDIRNFNGQQDKGAALFWNYWDQLERSTDFQNNLRN
jgi:nitrite reductase/ring-hydroxylating ferredoxin subunit